MDSIHGLHISCWRVKQPIHVQAMSAVHDAAWRERKRTDSQQRDVRRLVDVRDECRDFNECLHVAALPAGEARSSCCESEIRAPTHLVCHVQTGQGVVYCRCVMEWDVSRGNGFSFGRVDRGQCEGRAWIAARKQGLQEVERRFDVRYSSGICNPGTTRRGMNDGGVLNAGTG